jgi:hypothetical protein
MLVSLAKIRDAFKIISGLIVDKIIGYKGCKD